MKPTTRDVYMVLTNDQTGAIYVKTYEFFRGQGGFTAVWGKAWTPIIATSIEDARKKANNLPIPWSYERQARQ